MPKEIILLIAYIIVVFYIATLRRRKLFVAGIVAFALSLAWTVVAGDIYQYTTNTITIAGVNLYALVAWSLGLTVCFLLYDAVLRTFPMSSIWRKLVLFNGIYLPLLVVVEAVAYHGFGVVNMATASHAGLPLCDCLHAPVWMQAMYFFMGTIYFLFVYIANRSRFDSLRKATVR